MNSSWKTVLDFEKPIYELEKKIDEMRGYLSDPDHGTGEAIEKLEKKAQQLRQEIFGNLTRWQRVQLARHAERPYTLDYMQRIAEKVIELHGDRRFGEDNAIVAGMAKLDRFHVMIIGHQKGRDTKSNLFRNFGMPHPEGYRKALRLMELAAKFGRPIITLIDTPGAYPGIGAEERGQAEAIARNLLVMSHLPVPIICIVIGEGGSGGALALGIGDRVFMLENSVYSVITPEGCASILYRDASKAPLAAEAMKMTAQDCLELKVVDDIIPEPPGGAHRDYEETARILKQRIVQELAELTLKDPKDLIKERIGKFSKMGFWEE
jgi:acetyl-CoA carboxylase carboxyl transferase subunit alpha